LTETLLLYINKNNHYERARTMAGKTSKYGDTALHSIDFVSADIENFQSFADQVAEVLPYSELTFHEKPFFGKPYVQVDVRQSDKPWDRFTLMLDEGETLHVGSVEVWIGRDSWKEEGQ
jgi:hypothetical protein